MGHDPVAGFQRFDGPLAVRRQNRRSGGEAVEDIGSGGDVIRRTAPNQGREVMLRRVVGDEISVRFDGARTTENGVGPAFVFDHVPRVDDGWAYSS